MVSRECPTNHGKPRDLTSEAVHYNFYVFQYSTGISAAVALVQDILEEGQPAADRYLDFLQRGSSEYPLELLRAAGVDMSTSEPIERALDVYDERLEQAEELV